MTTATAESAHQNAHLPTSGTATARAPAITQPVTMTTATAPDNGAEIAQQTTSVARSDSGGNNESGKWVGVVVAIGVSYHSVLSGV